MSEALNELALFAGAGGGILGGVLLGWRTVCAVEIDPYARSVLLARQNDGTLPPFPVWDDIRTFDGTPWRGRVDVVSGGFPCTDISAAGKGAGINGEHSGLWKEMARVVGQVRPRFVFIENSPLLRTRGFEQVQEDLAEMGYGCKWGVVGARDVGAPHRRDRMWIVADTESLQHHSARPKRQRRVVSEGSGIAGGIRPMAAKQFAPRRDHGAVDSGRELADTESIGFVGREYEAGYGLLRDEQKQIQTTGSGDCETDVSDAACKQYKSHSHERQPQREDIETNDLRSAWPTEPDVGRVAHGVAARMDRLKSLGNGQVPRVAATAWRLLTNA